MKYLKILLLLAIASVNLYAQDTAKIKRSAEIVVKATLIGDFKTVAMYTYPKVVEAMGGTNKMIELMDKTIAEMKSQGVIIKAGEIGQPGVILNTGVRLYSVIPEKIIIEVNGKRFYSTSSLLAISSNKGIDWYFIDAGNLSDEKVRQIFPDTRDKLIIPKLSVPIAIE
jgi:hypothetical protein